MQLSRRILFALPFLAARTAPASPSEEPVMTDGFANGRLWQTLGEDHKSVFLLGSRDGAHITLQFACGEPNGHTVEERLGRVFPRSRPAKQLVAALDTFYQDPRNLPIPIAMGLEIEAMRDDGMAPADVEDIIRKSQETFARFGKK